MITLSFLAVTGWRPPCSSPLCQIGFIEFVVAPLALSLVADQEPTSALAVGVFRVQVVYLVLRK